MRPVHVIGVGQVPPVLARPEMDEAELVQAAAAQAMTEAGLGKDDVGFFCSGSSDYVMGRPFSFAMAIDGVGLWPPKRESHVEMDGAWALYEAWVRLQHGDVDVAMAFSFGRGALTDVDRVLALQADPYTVAPLGLDPASIAGLQARALLDGGHATLADLDRVVDRAYAAGAANPHLPDVAPPEDGDALVASPLRRRHLPRRTDGCTAVLMAVGGTGPRIDGFAHIVDTHHLGLRDLADSPSTRKAAEAARATNLDVVELSAAYAPHELVLCRALGVDAGVSVNPSGGALVADTPWVSGLDRIAEAVRAVRGGARRALGHATTGPALQHNLLCVLEAS